MHKCLSFFHSCKLYGNYYILYKDENRVASAGSTGPPIPMENYPAPAHGPLHPGPGYNQAMTNTVVVQQVCLVQACLSKINYEY